MIFDRRIIMLFYNFHIFSKIVIIIHDYNASLRLHTMLHKNNYNILNYEEKII